MKITVTTEEKDIQRYRASARLKPVVHAYLKDPFLFSLQTLILLLLVSIVPLAVWQPNVSELLKTLASLLFVLIVACSIVYFLGHKGKYEPAQYAPHYMLDQTMKMVASYESCRTYKKEALRYRHLTVHDVFEINKLGWEEYRRKKNTERSAMSKTLNEL